MPGSPVMFSGNSRGCGEGNSPGCGEGGGHRLPSRTRARDLGLRVLHKSLKDPDTTCFFQPCLRPPQYSEASQILGCLAREQRGYLRPVMSTFFNEFGTPSVPTQGLRLRLLQVLPRSFRPSPAWQRWRERWDRGCRRSLRGSMVMQSRLGFALLVEAASQANVDSTDQGSAASAASTSSLAPFASILFQCGCLLSQGACRWHVPAPRACLILFRQKGNVVFKSVEDIPALPQQLPASSTSVPCLHMIVFCAHLSANTVSCS